MPSPAVSKHGRLWIIYKLVSIVKRISLKCYARKNLAPYPHGPSFKHQLYPILSTWEKKMHQRRSSQHALDLTTMNLCTS